MLRCCRRRDGRTDLDLRTDRSEIGKGSQLLHLLLRGLGERQLRGGALRAQLHRGKVFGKADADAEDAGEQERCQQDGEDGEGVARPIGAQRTGGEAIERLMVKRMVLPFHIAILPSSRWKTRSAIRAIWSLWVMSRIV